jgi:hypothetical protein
MGMKEMERGARRWKMEVSYVIDERFMLGRAGFVDIRFHDMNANAMQCVVTLDYNFLIRASMQ